MLIIDRIENGIAVIENDDGSHFEMKCGQLPMSIREGDVIKSENGRYVIDYEMTQKCRDEIRNLQKKNSGEIKVSIDVFDKIKNVLSVYV